MNPSNRKSTDFSVLSKINRSFIQTSFDYDFFTNELSKILKEGYSPNNKTINSLQAHNGHDSTSLCSLNSSESTHSRAGPSPRKNLVAQSTTRTTVDSGLSSAASAVPLPESRNETRANDIFGEVDFFHLLLF